MGNEDQDDGLDANNRLDVDNMDGVYLEGIDIFDIEDLEEEM